MLQHSFRQSSAFRYSSSWRFVALSGYWLAGLGNQYLTAYGLGFRFTARWRIRLFKPTTMRSLTSKDRRRTAESGDIGCPGRQAKLRVQAGMLVSMGLVAKLLPDEANHDCFRWRDQC